MKHDDWIKYYAEVIRLAKEQFMVLQRVLVFP